MIEVRNLVKKYGDHVAVDHLNFTVEKGKIYGFLGPNGAGKSTTMNMITGYIASTEGDILIDGHNILEEPEEAKKKIGYLPELPPLYQDMTAREYLEFAAELKGIPKEKRQGNINGVMSTTKIQNVKDRLIKNLSKGYKQRVGLAQALLGDPEVLILDESMVGLDPKQIIEIRVLIRSLGKKHTVILSSHILSEITSICDHVMIISHGKLVASDTPENLGHYMKNSDMMELQIRGSREACEKARELLKKVKGLEIKTAAASLEDVFLELTSGDPETAETEETEETEMEETETEETAAEETTAEVAAAGGAAAEENKNGEEEEWNAGDL